MGGLCIESEYTMVYGRFYEDLFAQTLYVTPLSKTIY